MFTVKAFMTKILVPIHVKWVKGKSFHCWHGVRRMSFHFNFCLILLSVLAQHKGNLVPCCRKQRTILGFPAVQIWNYHQEHTQVSYAKPVRNDIPFFCWEREMKLSLISLVKQNNKNFEHLGCFSSEIVYKNRIIHFRPALCRFGGSRKREENISRLCTF